MTTKTKTKTASKKKTATKSITVDLSRDSELDKGIKTAEKAIRDLRITTAEECQAAASVLSKVAKLRRATVARFKVRKAPVLEAQRAVRALELEALSACEAIEKELNRKIAEFREADRLRREAIEQERRQLQEANAEAERAAMVANLRELAKKTADEEARKLIEQQADVVEKAEAIVEPVELEEEPQLLAEGQHEREHWHAVVDSFESLVMQIAAQKMIASGAPEIIAKWLQQYQPNAQATLLLLQPSMFELNRFAARLREDLQLRGVRAVKDTGIVSR